MGYFDILNSIYYDKKEWSDFSEEDQSTFIPYMVHQAVSQNEQYCEVANIIQEKLYIQPELVYNFYKHILPKEKKFTKWIKKTTPTYSKELLILLGEYWGCSSREAKDYIDIFTKQQIQEILESLGKNNVDIKTLLK